MPLPTITSYGQYSSDNYGLNTLRIDIGSGLSIWFSYQTPVAFQVLGESLVIRQNDWGPTTGKHLNWISRNAKRISGSDFEKLWNEKVEPRLNFSPQSQA